MNESVSLQIEGMTCSSCVTRVEKSLKSKKGVSDAQVNLLSNKANVEFDSSVVSIQSLIDAVSDAGYKAKAETKAEEKKILLSVEGMHCANCVRSVESGLQKLDGIKDTKVMLTTNTAEVTFNETDANIDNILKKIKELGYKGTLLEDLSSKEKAFSERKQLKDMRKRFFISLILATPVFIFAMGHMYPFSVWFPAFAQWQMRNEIFSGMLLSNFIQFILTTPIQFILGWIFYKAAWKSIKNKSASMDVLVVLGTSAAYFYSIFSIFYPYIEPLFEGAVFFETSAILLTFIFLGKYLEEVTKGKTSEAIKKLIELRPKTARVLKDDEEIEVPIDMVQEGDICLIRPGESIPVDGVIKEGNSYINESMITGESVPVYKEEDDELIGGTIVENGFLKMEATRVGHDTTLSKIIQLVEEAQTSKLPIQKMADKISAIFVPIVVTISIITFFIWFILFNTNILSTAILPQGTTVFLFAFLIAISVVVISCPCALGLATPTAIMVGTGLGAQNGILIRSGEALERAKNIEVILLDKTGTITKGEPKVTDIIPLNQMTENEVLKIASSLEQGSEHSIALSIRNEAKEREIKDVAFNNFQAYPGKGISGKMNNEQYFFGNIKLLQDQKKNINEDLRTQIATLENEGKTVMILFNEKLIVGLLAIMDTIKENSKEAITKLNELGLTTVMVSGDNKRAARAIAQEVGIEEVHAEVLPDDKLEIVKQYQEEGKVVAFVGDGINDAPALTQANIGLAIGSGTDIAIESGDFILVKDDLRDVVTSIDLSKKTIQRVKMGLFWALFYNSIAIPIAAGLLFIPFGFVLPPEIAGLAMALSSVSVVLNSLLLKRYKNPFKRD